MPLRRSGADSKKPRGGAPCQKGTKGLRMFILLEKQRQNSTDTKRDDDDRKKQQPVPVQGKQQAQPLRRFRDMLHVVNLSPNKCLG